VVLKKNGATLTVSNGREHLSYISHIAPDPKNANFEESLDILSDVIANPVITEYKLEDQTEKVIQENEESNADHHAKFVDIIHATAYKNRTLGLPLTAPEHKAKKFNEHQLEKFLKNYYVANRMSLVATGVEHASFVTLAEKYFGNFPSSTSTPGTKEIAKYTGGATHVGSDSVYNLLGIVFEGPSLQNDKDLATQLVIDTILGGGDCNSNREVGGQSSRLYKNIMAKYEFVKSINSLSIQYSDSGLAGVYAEVEGDKISQVSQAIITELSQLRKNISQDELNRAKRQLKTIINFQLENSITYHEDLGRLAAVKKLLSPQQLLQAIDTVTAEDLVRVATKSLSSSPTLVTLGQHVHSAPALSDLVSPLK